jgi:hypothetical protein
MALRPLLLGLPLLALADAGFAEELRPPRVTFDGSLPWQYASNPGRSSADKHPDGGLSPYARLSASGRLGPELSYQFYVSAGVDKYFQFSDENGSVAAFGGHIGKRWEHAQLTFNYERALYYDGYFRGPVSVANDFGTTLRFSYRNVQDGFAAKPSMLAAFRTDDAGTLQRTLLSAKIGFEKTLSDKWTALLTPHLRHYEYQDARKGRRDTIFSISSGLKYDIATDISWTSSVGYEVRDSTVPTKSYVNYVVGTSIDFSFDLAGGTGGSDHVSLRDSLTKAWEKR